jgi:hypothetical protein
MPNKKTSTDALVTAMNSDTGVYLDSVILRIMGRKDERTSNRAHLAPVGIDKPVLLKAISRDKLNRVLKALGSNEPSAAKAHIPVASSFIAEQLKPNTKAKLERVLSSMGSHE